MAGKSTPAAETPAPDVDEAPPAPRTYAERVGAAIAYRQEAEAAADARLAEAVTAVHVARAAKADELAKADAAILEAVNGPKDEA